MSGMHGDKARFDRERKKNNLRQRHTRELRKKLRASNTESISDAAEGEVENRSRL